ncbi:MAG: hypothetical protein NTV30_10675 [Chloroflexi bacterium]|nr:hypothetical protein [Chloroflexota bacterium]
MDKVIATVLLIIGSVIAALAIFNGLYPAINQSSSSVTNASLKLSDRIESRVEIIQVGHNGSEVNVWVKNVGSVDIDSPELSDIFFGPENDFYRVTYGGETTPYWNWQLEGSNDKWRPTVTAKITIHPASSLSSGTYIVKIVIPNGIYDETTFGV